MTAGPGRRMCPRCGFPYYEPPALSRWDSATEVCSTCGMHEAMLQWVMQNGADKSAPRELVLHEVRESVHPLRGVVKWSKVPREARKPLETEASAPEVRG